MKIRLVKWSRFDPDNKDTHPDDLSKMYELAAQFAGSSIIYTGTGSQIIEYVRTLLKHGDRSSWFIRLWNEPK